MCVVCFETNIPHHQLCFTDAGIVSARIHHVVVGPLHTEHASWMLAGSLVDLSGRIHVPHDDASIHRSRHKSSALRRPTDRRNGALMSQPLARHHRLVFSDLPHFDFTPGVAHGDEAIVRRDSQRVDSRSVVLQLVRSHGARKANAFFAQLVHFHVLTSVLLQRHTLRLSTLRHPDCQQSVIRYVCGVGLGRKCQRLDELMLSEQIDMSRWNALKKRYLSETTAAWSPAQRTVSGCSSSFTALSSWSESRSVKRTVSSLRVRLGDRTHHPIDTHTPLDSTAPLQFPLWCYTSSRLPKATVTRRPRPCVHSITRPSLPPVNTLPISRE